MIPCHASQTRDLGELENSTDRAPIYDPRHLVRGHTPHYCGLADTSSDLARNRPHTDLVTESVMSPMDPVPTANDYTRSLPNACLRPN